MLFAMVISESRAVVKLTSALQDMRDRPKIPSDRTARSASNERFVFIPPLLI
jgi:hypothetical protein